MNLIQYKIIIKSYQKKNTIVKQSEINDNIKKINKRQMWLKIKHRISKTKIYKSEYKQKKGTKNKGTVGLISSPFVYKKGGKSFKEQMYRSTIDIWQIAKNGLSKTALLEKIIGVNAINNQYELKIIIKDHVK